MPKAFVNGINLHYVQTGEGPDLVLIHGIASNLGQWQLSILPAFTEHFRVTMYDLRGHGYSDMPPNGYTPNHMVGDFSGLMSNLSIQRATILGHSYGGMVALYYAVLHPERVDRLIIADSGIPSLEPGRGRDALLDRCREILQGQNIDVPNEKGEGCAILTGAAPETPTILLAKYGNTAGHGPPVASVKHDFLPHRVSRHFRPDIGDDSPDSDPRLAHLWRSFAADGQFSISS